MANTEELLKVRWAAVSSYKALSDAWKDLDSPDSDPEERLIVEETREVEKRLLRIVARARFLSKQRRDEETENVRGMARAELEAEWELEEWS